MRIREESIAQLQSGTLNRLKDDIASDVQVATDIKLYFDNYVESSAETPEDYARGVREKKKMGIYAGHVDDLIFDLNLESQALDIFLNHGAPSEEFKKKIRSYFQGQQRPCPRFR